jgi:predicted dehydrogenase
VPLCYSLDDCWRLVLAVERSGKTLAMEEQISQAPFVRAWQQLVRDGALGKVLYAEAEYIHGMHLDWYWQDERTGQRLTFEQARENPHAIKTRYWNIYHPIWYNPHSLGPLLRVLNERVVQVTCMATRRPSYYLPDVPLPDLEVALLKTEGDTIIRLAAGFVSPAPYPWHWYRLHGTLGGVETNRRSDSGVPDGRGSLHWRAGQYQRTRDEIGWTFAEHQPGAAAAAQTGHSGLDYYPFADFVESLIDDRPPLIDVYRAAEIAAPAAVAGRSADQGAVPLGVPDFRPGPQRRAGEGPD